MTPRKQIFEFHINSISIRSSAIFCFEKLDGFMIQRHFFGLHNFFKRLELSISINFNIIADNWQSF
jgi:hypothetical protein